jgi:hypothetical protein
MKAIGSLKELRAEMKKIDRGLSQDSMFAAKALLYMAEQLNGFAIAGQTLVKSRLLEVIAQQGQKKGNREKRKPSAWNQFFSQGMKAGKNPREIAEEWKNRKR